jgi:hypothetical protein
MTARGVKAAVQASKVVSKSQETIEAAGMAPGDAG